MTKTHELKCWTEYFNAIKSGEKTAEFRKNDRDYKIYDELFLREWSPEEQEYSGDTVWVEVTHIVYGGNFGIPEGYCVMSIKLVE